MLSTFTSTKQSQSWSKCSQVFPLQKLHITEYLGLLCKHPHETPHSAFHLHAIIINEAGGVGGTVMEINSRPGVIRLQHHSLNFILISSFI